MSVVDMTARRKKQIEDQAAAKKADDVNRMFSWLGFLKRSKTDVDDPVAVQQSREQFNQQQQYQRGSKNDPWMNN